MSETSTRYLGRATAAVPGNTKRKRILFLVGGGIGVLAVCYVIRKRNVESTAVDVTGGEVTDMAVDPSLDGGYSPALTSYTDPSTGAIISGGGWQSGVGSVGGQVLSAPSTNAQWVQQGIAYLVQQGFDPVAVSLALGKYIANQNLTNTELGMVQAALAVEGQPPTPVPPPHVAPPSGQGGNSTTGSVTKPATPTGFSISSRSKSAVTLHWNKMPGASSYGIHYNGVPISTTANNWVTVHRNGNYSVASKRGTYTSKYTPAVTVKGI